MDQKPESLAVTVGNTNIHDLCECSVSETMAFIRSLNLTEKEKIIGNRIIKEILERLGFLESVGLDYLTLSRNAGTLSGGERQRIRLATQVGSQLVNVFYILDEPTTGLHSEDVSKLILILQRLADAGNTVITIEHNLDLIKTADYIIDLGPEGGDGGGTIVAEGTPEEVAQNPASHTGAYLKKYL